MAVPSTVQLGVLGLLSLVGVVFVVNGYNLVNTLLAWIGWLAGAAAGGTAGWVATASTGSPNQLLMTGLGVVLGAIIGRILVIAVSWLAVVLLGFASTSLATLVVLAGTQFTTTITQINRVTSPEDIEHILEQLAATPVFQQQQTLLIVGFAGLVGAVLAAKYFRILIAATVTSIGAALLAIILPLWEPALAGTLALTESPPTNVTGSIFVASLLGGLLIQGYRFRNELEFPLLGSDFDPLQGQ